MARIRIQDHPCRNALALIALVFALIALGACGDDDEPGASPATDVDAVAPANPGDPEATAEPSVADAAEFPILTRGAVDRQVPAIRGSSEQTVEQWLHTVVNDTATFWQQTFNQAGYKFKPVNYIVYTRAVPGCGGDRAGLNEGPAYCIGERKVYMSVPFFQNFYGRFGDTAMAIPIAHELGHHVQNNLKVFRNPRYRSIEIELGADCLAGIWAHSVFERDLFEPGDIEEALQSRVAVADPEGTSEDDPQAHGTREQRVNAFMAGYENPRDAGVCVPQPGQKPGNPD